jgi:hypothetical protein
MAKVKIFDRETNLTVTGGRITATTGTSSTFWRIGDSVTNARVMTGELSIAHNGAHDHFLTIDDTKTNISLDSNGRINVNDHPAEADHTAKLWGLTTNLNLDSAGRIIVDNSTASSTGTLNIGGAIINVNLGSGSGLGIGDITETLNNLLLETGDDLLQENGSYIMI